MLALQKVLENDQYVISVIPPIYNSVQFSSSTMVTSLRILQLLSLTRCLILVHWQ